MKQSVTGTEDDPKDLLARAYALDGAAQAIALYRDWAATYDATMLDGLGYLTPHRTAGLLADHCADHAAPLLDIGCGTGLAGQALAGLGFSVIDGLDFSAEMLAVAGQRNIYRALFEADLNAPLSMISDNAYGALISTGTFTHAHVGANCLDELLRVLAPGGVFACTIHEQVWEPAGFAEKIAAWTASGQIEPLFAEPGTYYAASTEPEGFYFVWRKTGRGTEEAA